MDDGISNQSDFCFLYFHWRIYVNVALKVVGCCDKGTLLITRVLGVSHIVILLSLLHVPIIISLSLQTLRLACLKKTAHIFLKRFHGHLKRLEFKFERELLMIAKTQQAVFDLLALLCSIYTGEKLILSELASLLSKMLHLIHSCTNISLCLMLCGNYYIFSYFKT